MNDLLKLKSNEVFRIFSEICSIPHGSGNMDLISEYCVNFAKKNNLKFVCDDSKNVIIYKPAAKGYEQSEPIILQAHIDMVCQKDEHSKIDFENDGLDVFVDGDFVSANGTTLGADNGIAVAMLMAILESNTLHHPPVEAVFTTDEEIGMLGASSLDTNLLKSKRMINLDSEEEDFLTVSCAGGSDFKLFLPVNIKQTFGTKISLTIRGFRGGHSGVEINKGRINANALMGRILCHESLNSDFCIASINGGAKANAIPSTCTAELVSKAPDALIASIKSYFSTVKAEIGKRDADCSISIETVYSGDFDAFDSETTDKLIYLLTTTPNGITDMSVDIEGLVETSLNLGVMCTNTDCVILHYALRSNKSSALANLEEKLTLFAKYNNCNFEISGRYMPWEFKEISPLRELYSDTFCEIVGHKPQVIAIHAGLECAVFASKIEGLDCISVGPDMFDVHTPKERLSISSTEKMYNILCNMLQKLK